MKLFLTIFTAILAAAAVIWGVQAYRASKAADAAQDLRILKLMTESSKMEMVSAVTYGNFDEHHWVTLNMTPDSARQFERILRTGRVDRTDARSLAFDFVYNYREVIKIVRVKSPENLKWADDLEPLLTNVEVAAR